VLVSGRFLFHVVRDVVLTGLVACCDWMSRSFLLIVLLWGSLLSVYPVVGYDRESLTGATYGGGQTVPVCIASGDVCEFAVSGDGSWIAYRTENDRHLVVIAPDGSNLKNISLPADGRCWGTIESSPDGQWIYYQGANYTEPVTAFNFWKLRPDGSELTMVSEIGRNTSHGYPTRFSVHPNGEYCAFIHREPDLDAILLTTVNWTAIAMTPLFSDANFSVDGLQWSMAGCAFWGHYSPNNYSLYLTNEYHWLRSVVGNQPKQEAYRYPNGSPDGSKFLATSTGYHSEMFVWMLDVDGLNPFPVIKGYYKAQWFPSGDQIAMIGAPWSSSATQAGLYVMDLPTPLTDLDSDGDGLTNYEEWSTYGTDFELADSDYDGLGDGVEVRTGFDPLNRDTDNDGIRDGREFVLNFGENTTATPLPDGFIRLTLQWTSYSMIVTSNSTMLNATFNALTQKCLFGVDGELGTIAVCNLTLPSAMVPDPSAIKVFLDGSSIHFTYVIVRDTVQIYVEYPHSAHLLSISIGSDSTIPPGFPRFLFAAIALGLILALSIVFVIWNHRRKQSAT
jgi:hypothetical protein